MGGSDRDWGLMLGRPQQSLGCWVAGVLAGFGVPGWAGGAQQSLGCWSGEGPGRVWGAGLEGSPNGILGTRLERVGRGTGGTGLGKIESQQGL